MNVQGGGPWRRWTLLVACVALLMSCQLVNGQALRPLPRHGHRLVHDVSAEVTLLFGGKTRGDQFLSDTWALTGQGWVQIEAGGPSARAWFALAYDVRRQVVVLHGGRNSAGASMDDTWEWDGRRWTQVESAGPGARDHHAMTYDPVREETVLFGGYDPSTRLSKSDTWAWDGEKWRSLDSSIQPGPRDAHGMVFVEDREEVFVFGGMNVHSGTTVWADSWAWDGTRWRHREPGEVDGRSHFAMSWDPSCRCIWRFGGGGPERTPVADTWRGNGHEWVKIDTAGPSARVDHAMAYDPVRQVTILFGGYLPTSEGAIYGDTWEWDGQDWLER